MKCQSCGMENSDGVNFCVACGRSLTEVQDGMSQQNPGNGNVWGGMMNNVPTQEQMYNSQYPMMQQPYYNQQQYSNMVPMQMNNGYGQPKPSNGVGIAGMVLGICSIVFFWVPVFDFVLALVGLILSALGMSNKYKGNTGTATAGLVCSILTIIFSVIYMTACGGWYACAACSSVYDFYY